MKDIYEIIRWWESLSDKEMNDILGDYFWNGTTEERHKKLREFYKKFH